MQAVAIIPARLAATRLPNKPLADIGGKPMIQHVYERTRRAAHLSDVLVATPDAEIRTAVEAFGGKAVLTSNEHRTGTDRVAEAARSLPESVTVILNVQGDEPLIDPATIDALAAPLLADESLVMASVMAAYPEGREGDPNAVKVVTDRNGFALYFSRSPLPYRRNLDAPYAPKLHVGLYGYRRDFLMRLTTLPPTPLEQLESLEQLRVLEHGYRIRMVAADRPPESVDTPEDLERVRNLIASGG
jgi:3-deoxy-manno-octulosonate cytidylyltransferase (CMP-KDO synthetase)